jgi:hypothetical protein
MPAKVISVQVLAIVVDAGQSCCIPSFGYKNRRANPSHSRHFFSSPLMFKRSNLNIRDLPLGLRRHIETRVTRTQETMSQELQALKRQELQDDKLDLLLII